MELPIPLPLYLHACCSAQQGSEGVQQCPRLGWIKNQIQFQVPFVAWELGALHLVANGWMDRRCKILAKIVRSNSLKGEGQKSKASASSNSKWNLSTASPRPHSNEIQTALYKIQTTWATRASSCNGYPHQIGLSHHHGEVGGGGWHKGGGGGSGGTTSANTAECQIRGIQGHHKDPAPCHGTTSAQPTLTKTHRWPHTNATVSKHLQILHKMLGGSGCRIYCTTP